MKTFTVPASNIEAFERLERAHYEVNSRANIIAYLINNNQVNTDLFTQYHEDYVTRFMEYEMLKQQVNIDYNMAQYGENASWSADFPNKQFIITKND